MALHAAIFASAKSEAAIDDMIPSRILCMACQGGRGRTKERTRAAADIALCRVVVVIPSRIPHPRCRVPDFPLRENDIAFPLANKQQSVLWRNCSFGTAVIV